MAVDPPDPNSLVLEPTLHSCLPRIIVSPLSARFAPKPPCSAVCFALKPAQLIPAVFLHERCVCK